VLTFLYRLLVEEVIEVRDFSMVLEATMICLDNSEYMRNGDFPPTRLDAQSDAANIVCSAKLEQNAENVVGILTAAGNHSRILETSTQDPTVILSCLHSVQPSGELQLTQALLKAQLALKHKPNPHQRARIIAFVGSPLSEIDIQELPKLGRLLKKNGVAVDIISFGEHEANQDALSAFIGGLDAGNSENASRLLVVDSQTHQLLSDVVLMSPLLRVDGGRGGGDGEGRSGVGGGSGEEFPFGVDPAVDPELAMALRISMEEEQARIAASAAAAGPSETQEDGNGDEELYGKEEGDMDESGDGGGQNDEEDVDEEEMMRVAIEMSLAEQKEQGEKKETDDKME